MIIKYQLIMVETVTISADRVCDINTFADWSKAEEMYGKLRGNYGR